MVPTKGGRYEYRPASIVTLRKQLGQTQAQMAKQLGIPPNTLSRWETGTTTPDAESLAAMYSLGAARGFSPNFFQRKKLAPRPSKGRTRLLVMWDFQNAGIQVADLPGLVSRIRKALDERFASASYRLFKAFATPLQANATDVLDDLGWGVWEDFSDIDGELTAHARSDCGQKPKETAFVLVANDGDYRDLMSDLEELGVAVYLLTLGRGGGQRLASVVGKERLIRID